MIRSFSDGLTSDVLMGTTVGTGRSGQQGRRSRTVVAMSPRSSSRWFLPLLATLLLTAGCSDAESPGTATASIVPPGQTATVPLGDRPFQLYVPNTYTPSQPMPLVVALHGYSSFSAEMESYFQLKNQAEERGFLYALPDGTVDFRGNEFWNAADACCDFGDTGVDDSGYLRSLIEQIKRTYTVGKVVFVGHSNGGYMSYRMACEHADLIDGIASLAGSTFADAARCTPSRPVTVLQIHGTRDGVVFYGGSLRPGSSYPSAEELVNRWRALDGCSDAPSPEPQPELDLDSSISGAETTVIAYGECDGDARVQLWRMEGSSHVPALTEDFTPAILDFLLGGDG